jgi:hypothetical protein
VLEIVGIDDGPAHSLDQPGGEVVRLQVERSDPLAEQHDLLFAVVGIAEDENLRHRAPPSSVVEIEIVPPPHWREVNER